MSSLATDGHVAPVPDSVVPSRPTRIPQIPQRRRARIPPARRAVLRDVTPFAQVRSDAPPFFILRGTHDSLASVKEARRFAEQLRAVSQNPVAYAELPGAQHAWDVFRSVRAMESVQAITRFLEWARGERG